MEHRWGNRVSAGVEVQVSADASSAGWGRLRDISVSGGFVETALRIPVLSTLSMVVPAMRAEGTRVVHAIVVRRDAGGVGVEWFDSQSDAINTLMRRATEWQVHECLANDIHLQPGRSR